MEDLDALVAEPLQISIGGKEFALELTVATMIAVSKAQEKGDASAMETAILVMENAGFPRADFLKLQPRQATRLSEAIAERFFPPNLAAEVPKKVDSPLLGPMPLSDSSAPSGEPTE